MEQDEIRAEIERRRQRAIALKLRETIWAIYKHLRSYAALFKSDPATIYPGVRETLLITGNEFRFCVGQSAYRVICRETGGGTFWDSGSETTSAMLTLFVAGERVFEFRVKKIMRDSPDMPVCREYMDEVNAFIEGPWTDDAPELLRNIKEHAAVVQEKKSPKRRERQLQEEMKRFGL